MKSLRAASLLICIVLVALPASADVTMTMTMAMAGGFAPMETTAVTFVKGMKMRSDMKVMGQDISIFVDVATKQQLMVNNVTKEVTDVAAALANMPVTIGNMTMSVKPNGQTKEVLGRSCEGYTVEYSTAMTMMGETITMAVSGVVWVAKDAPGAAEFMAFSKAAAAAGMISTVFAQGPQAKGMTQLQAALVEKGIPFEQELQLNMTGKGQVGQMMAQSGAGSVKISVRVVEISTTPIAAETFVMPAAAPKK